MIFYAVRYPMGTSAARPNFSSPLRSPMKNFQRSLTRAKPVLCSAFWNFTARGGTPPGTCPEMLPEFNRSCSCSGKCDFGYMPGGHCPPAARRPRGLPAFLFLLERKRKQKETFTTLQYTTFPRRGKAFFTISLRLYSLYKLNSLPEPKWRGKYIISFTLFVFTAFL